MIHRLFVLKVQTKEISYADSDANPGGVLGISSDGDDRMEPKVKTQKNPYLGLPAKPQKIPGPKINPQKISCRFCGA